ncbi:PEP-CTERM sorting domain-containing protein [Aquabacterium sp. A7-Y]|nr:PEP-CTERM sorting domain-containing protein [Aquabacterium sp. A7-Y]MCW7540003.1 PEP-CTERM sorting domain-containing protein [Aquabacterium sp. A7-Y]
MKLLHVLKHGMVAVGCATAGTAALAGLYTLVSSVPEPETYALLLAGLMIMLVLNRRRFGD